MDIKVQLACALTMIKILFPFTVLSLSLAVPLWSSQVGQDPACGLERCVLLPHHWFQASRRWQCFWKVEWNKGTHLWHWWPALSEVHTHWFKLWVTCRNDGISRLDIESTNCELKQKDNSDWQSLLKEWKLCDRI